MADFAAAACEVLFVFCLVDAKSVRAGVLAPARNACGVASGIVCALS